MEEYYENGKLMFEGEFLNGKEIKILIVFN